MTDARSDGTDASHRFGVAASAGFPLGAAASNNRCSELERLLRCHSRNEIAMTFARDPNLVMQTSAQLSYRCLTATAPLMVRGHDWSHGQGGRAMPKRIVPCQRPCKGGHNLPRGDVPSLRPYQGKSQLDSIYVLLLWGVLEVGGRGEGLPLLAKRGDC